MAKSKKKKQFSLTLDVYSDGDVSEVRVKVDTKREIHFYEFLGALEMAKLDLLDPGAVIDCKKKYKAKE